MEVGLAENGPFRSSRDLFLYVFKSLDFFKKILHRSPECIIDGTFFLDIFSSPIDVGTIIRMTILIHKNTHQKSGVPG